MRNIGPFAIITMAAAFLFVAAPILRPSPLSLPFETVVFVAILTFSIWIWRAGVTQAAGTSGGMTSTFSIFAILFFMAAQGIGLVTALNPYVPPQYAPPTAAGLTFSGDQITLFGPITLRAFTQVSAHISENGAPKVVQLNSPGGNVHAARGLARLIAESGAKTIATGPCQSSCTLVFLAGNPRVLAQGASLGFHSYSTTPSKPSGSIGLSDLTNEVAKDKAFLRRHGVSDPFIEKAYATPNTQMWTPTRAELVQAGVLKP